jgi:hypothetical protein
MHTKSARSDVAFKKLSSLNVMWVHYMVPMYPFFDYLGIPYTLILSLSVSMVIVANMLAITIPPMLRFDVK